MSSPTETRGEKVGGFKKLVRSLSRSGPRSDRSNSASGGLPSYRRTKSSSSAIGSPSKEVPPVPEGTVASGGDDLAVAKASLPITLGGGHGKTSPGSSGLPPGAGHSPTNGISTSPNAKYSGLSMSPPPDSYFPAPPRATMRDKEASGISRHPDTLGARAADFGEVKKGAAAPGVSFAPSSADQNQRRPNSELEGWTPPPRRTQSQRRKDKKPEGPYDSMYTADQQNSAVAPRARSTSTGSAVMSGERSKGVQLEDKPLTRSTSVKRAASGVRKAVERIGFVPADKAEGEQRVMVLVADGSEEIEVLTAYDVFMRASLSPVIISVSPQFSPSQSLPYITLSRGAKLIADTQFETLKELWKDDFDAVYVPGGAKGAERLSKDKGVQELIRRFHSQGKLVAMICAGALTARTAGIAWGERITSHPSVRAELEKDYKYSEERVVVSGNLVTSRGPGTSLEFSLKIVEMLAGKAKRDEVAGPMIL